MPFPSERRLNHFPSLFLSREKKGIAFSRTISFVLVSSSDLDKLGTARFGIIAYDYDELRNRVTDVYEITNK